MVPMLAPLASPVPLPIDYAVGLGPAGIFIGLLLFVALGVVYGAATRQRRTFSRVARLRPRTNTTKPVDPTDRPLAA